MNSFNCVEYRAFKIIHWFGLKKFTGNFAKHYSCNDNVGNVASVVNAANQSND